MTTPSSASTGARWTLVEQAARLEAGDGDGKPVVRVSNGSRPDGALTIAEADLLRERLTLLIDEAEKPAQLRRLAMLREVANILGYRIAPTGEGDPRRPGFGRYWLYDDAMPDRYPNIDGMTLDEIALALRPACQARRRRTTR